LDSADPGTPPGALISVSRDAPNVALGARLRFPAHEAEGFGPEPVPADGPHRGSPDGQNPVPAYDRNRAR
jgi:hypothetical protein